MTMDGGTPTQTTTGDETSWDLDDSLTRDPPITAASQGESPAMVVVSVEQTLTQTPTMHQDRIDWQTPVNEQRTAIQDTRQQVTRLLSEVLLHRTTCPNIVRNLAHLTAPHTPAHRPTCPSIAHNLAHLRALHIHIPPPRTT